MLMSSQTKIKNFMNDVDIIIERIVALENALAELKIIVNTLQKAPPRSTPVEIRKLPSICRCSGVVK